MSTANSLVSNNGHFFFHSFHGDESSHGFACSFLKVSHGCNKVLTGLHSFPGLLSAPFSGFCGCAYLLVVVGLPPHFLFVFSSWRPLASFPQGPLKGLLTTWQFTLSGPAVRSLLGKGSQSLFKDLQLVKLDHFQS